VNLGFPFQDAIGQLQPVHFRHPHVCEQQGNPGLVLLTQGDRGLRAVRQEHGVSGVLKERSYHGADTGLIVSHRILRGSLK
jgi:hypothetical protein